MFVVLVATLTLGCCFGPTASIANPLVWSAPVKVEASGFPLESVSCPSATFCATVSNHGNAFTYNGSSWSAAAKIDTEIPLAVSCASEVFCVAVTNGGDAITYNGSSWSAPAEISSNASTLYSVSCVSATFCAVVGTAGGDGYALTYNGSSWSAPAKVDNSATLYSVSCPSATFCVAVDNAGYALTYNGSSWSAPAKVNNSALDSVSCASATSCVAVGSNGYVTLYASGSWTTPVQISIWKLDSVSCTSPTYCVAVDYYGRAISYNGTSWSAPMDIDHGVILYGVSCLGVSFCVAVDGYGYALTYAESSLPLPANIKPPTITGSPVQGQTLAESHGEWSGNPTEYSYQWQRCSSAGGGCEEIANAITQTYLLTATDVGHTIKVTETAKNISGTGIPASSAATTVVQAPPAPKEKTTKPPKGGTKLPPKVVRCIVPKLKGKTLAKARKLLVRNHCRLGKVTKRKRHGKHHGKYKVISQKPRAGKVLPKGARIALLLRK